MRELKAVLTFVVKKVKYLFSFPNTYRYSELDIPTLDMFFECEIENILSIKVADDVASAKFYKLEDIRLEEIGLQSIRNSVSFYIAQKNKNKQ